VILNRRNVMKLYAAIHEIHYRENGVARIAVPGAVFSPAEVDEDMLVKAGAVREPTDAEVALYERTASRKSAAETPAVTPAATPVAAPAEPARGRGRPAKATAAAPAAPVAPAANDDVI
jgi:hypothetical protein